MDAVIPAAGRGTRLGELTADRPKRLVEVAGRSLLSHIFETAVEAGANELVVIVGTRRSRSSTGSGTPSRGLLLRTSTSASGWGSGTRCYRQSRTSTGRSS